MLHKAAAGELTRKTHEILKAKWDEGSFLNKLRSHEGLCSTSGDR